MNVRLIVNNKPYGKITLESLTLSEAYYQIINLDSNDPRYKFFFVLNNEEVGKIKLGPKNKLLNTNLMIFDIISKENELYVKRELLITIYDGKTIKNFFSINKLNSKLSDIHGELIDKKIISPEFNFLREDLKKENLQEILLECEKSITLEEILINDVMRILSASKFSSGKISSTSLSNSLTLEPCFSSLLYNDEIDYVKQNIHNYKLDYGLSFIREGVKHGTHRLFDFIQSIKYSIPENYDSFMAELLTTKRINDFFIVKNQLDISNSDNLPSELQILLNYEDQYLNKGNICFIVVNKRIELHVRKELIRPSKEFENAVDRAINGTDPYLKLKKVFAIFGNFIAQRVILGHKLFNYTEVDCAKIDTIKKNQAMMLYIDKNDNFLTPNGKIIGRDEFNGWVESCYKTYANLQVVGYRDLVTIYEIFEEPTRDRIKSILKAHENDYSLLKTLGSIEEVDMFKTYHSLSKSIYQEDLKLSDIKQKILMTDTLWKYYINIWEQLNGKIIKFKATNVFGFTLIISLFRTNDSRKMVINWMLVGYPEIINIVEPENIENLVGSQEISFNHENSWVISLPILSKLPINSVFAYSFKYPLSNSDSSLLACVKFDRSNNIRINITNYTDYDNELKDNFKYRIYWCIYITSIQKVTIGQFIFKEDITKTIRMIKNKPSAKACVSKKEKDYYEAILTKKHKGELLENIKQNMAGTSNELNELISNIFEGVTKNINNEGNEVIKKYEYNLFSNLIVINSGPFGNIYKATWENSTIVLKSKTIDTSQIDSKIISESKNAINYNKIISFDDAIASYEKWIESKIIEGKIHEHNIDEFEDYKLISSGATSKVYRARYKSTKNLCALKFIEKNNHTSKELVNEDPNVVKYVLILEYANNGTLRDYLHQNSTKIEWELKVQFAIQLVEAVKWLHAHNIVYGDLEQSKNVKFQRYRKNKKSDIYSIGVILWEISTEKQPFKNLDPCWQSLQDDQPSIKEVAMAFEVFIVQDITENDSFDIFDKLGFEEFITNTFETINFNIEMDATAFSQDEMTHFVYNLYSTFSKLFNEGKSVRDIIINYISKNNKSNEEVFKWLLENCTHSTKNKCAAAEYMLGEYFYKLRKYNRAFYYLKSATKNGNFKVLNTLGLCYQRGQGTDTNAVEGFRSFKRAALWGLPTSQYELGNCYKYGIGTEINLIEALKWYKKATKANSNYRVHQKRAKIKISSKNY
ncbi:4752_t:CDS:10 [Gigaspora margarita]|uniref:4752_t:CDS:1 n=1 Tax=Gigaspora margarita TaxID=4874 RepID=A0ABN7UR11_GIGMA|nr:4752_t:CDS:10 [Gigaspora margarita]